MRSLLLATSLISFIFFKTCGSNSTKKEEIKNDSITVDGSKEKLTNPVDSSQSTHSDVQYSDPNQPNVNNGVKQDSTKTIHTHQGPNQHELDSIKAAKTKNKK